nr:MAG TPA: hypothetical protein [Caudoviricetes sp.]
MVLDFTQIWICLPQHLVGAAQMHIRLKYLIHVVGVIRVPVNLLDIVKLLRIHSLFFGCAEGDIITSVPVRQEIRP